MHLIWEAILHQDCPLTIFNKIRNNLFECELVVKRTHNQRQIGTLKGINIHTLPILQLIPHRASATMPWGGLPWEKTQISEEMVWAGDKYGNVVPEFVPQIGRKLPFGAV